MTTLFHPDGAVRDHSMSGDGLGRRIGGGSRLESSDPYMDWAIRFEHGLTLAEDRIRAWERDPAALVEEDIEPPSRESVARALRVIDQLKTLVMDRVHPGSSILLNLKGVSLGTGGEICFELGAGPFAITYRIEPDGSLTAMHFKNHRLVRDELVPR
ncbi:MAG: hypothetical protein KIS87_13910 [Phycisphaeraceae bacterium]|nr:hypothetical protein [Phycisphaeraceae bacterium]